MSKSEKARLQIQRPPNERAIEHPKRRTSVAQSIRNDESPGTESAETQSDSGSAEAAETSSSSSRKRKRKLATAFRQAIEADTDNEITREYDVGEEVTKPGVR